MHRAEGQHDDLARVPRTGPRQGGHRWAAPPRNGRGPALRPPPRMVASAPDAGFYCTVATFQTASPLTTVSVSGKRDSEGQRQHPEIPSWTGLVPAETKPSTTNARQLGAIPRVPGNLR